MIYAKHVDISMKEMQDHYNPGLLMQEWYAILESAVRAHIRELGLTAIDAPKLNIFERNHAFRLEVEIKTLEVANA